MIQPEHSAIGTHTMEDRLRELEAENVRLLSLVGELLVANQLLRERLVQAAPTPSSNPHS